MINLYQNLENVNEVGVDRQKTSREKKNNKLQESYIFQYNFWYE